MPVMFSLFLNNLTIKFVEHWLGFGTLTGWTHFHDVFLTLFFLYVLASTLGTNERQFEEKIKVKTLTKAQMLTVCVWLYYGFGFSGTNLGLVLWLF